MGYENATQNLKTYKDGKKSAAETTALVASVGTSVAVGAVTVGVGGVVASAVTSGAVTSLAKEAMLGDEYDLGKDGVKDFATSAVWTGLGGGAGMLTAGSGMLTKVGGKVLADQCALAITSEDYRNTLKNGEIDKIVGAAATPATVGYIANKINPSTVTGKVAKAQGLVQLRKQVADNINNYSQSLKFLYE